MYDLQVSALTTHYNRLQKVWQTRLLKSLAKTVQFRSAHKHIKSNRKSSFKNGLVDPFRLHHMLYLISYQNEQGNSLNKILLSS